MRAAVLVESSERGIARSSVAIVDTSDPTERACIEVGRSPNVGAVPARDALLVAHTEPDENGGTIDWLDVHRLSDLGRQARIAMDCRPHFNMGPLWSVFVPAPGGEKVYVYKTRTVGDHHAKDFVATLDLATLAFMPLSYSVPECVAGWSPSGPRAHAQMLFVGDGVEKGALRLGTREQKVHFWLGPEESEHPDVAIGLRPVAHSDLGHARAILHACAAPLTVVACTDGSVHLIDPVALVHLGCQRIALQEGEGMPIFAAQIEPQGRLVYLGAAQARARCQGLSERIVVHDLASNRTWSEWTLPEPLLRVTLSRDGRKLCGLCPWSGRLWVLDATSGEVDSSLELKGSPRYLVPLD